MRGLKGKRRLSRLLWSLRWRINACMARGRCPACEGLSKHHIHDLSPRERWEQRETYYKALLADNTFGCAPPERPVPPRPIRRTWWHPVACGCKKCQRYSA